MTDQQVASDGDVPSRRRFLTALGGTALAAAGYGYGTGSGGSVTTDSAASSDSHPASEDHVATLTALASAVYPSTVSVDSSFIERHVFGRVEPEPGHFERLVAAIEAVDDHARARFGDGVTELSAGRRRQVLQSMGVTTVHPTADGTTAEQVRFYVVNDLLYALFTAPVGGELLGIDNPPGHPGGREAYQRGPGGDDR
ncbi:gluconate 2-dehydrogenase subunit 3 family protein [Haloarcula brevis]|uniref:gluconate 2-dehydrogenase subunit 3 family protein n=1 Tax=Haloarcula brevis TaxID=3111453 RepID=UPI00300F43B9